MIQKDKEKNLFIIVSDEFSEECETLEDVKAFLEERDEEYGDIEDAKVYEVSREINVKKGITLE